MVTSPLPAGAAITACMAQRFGLRGVRAWAARRATTGDAMALVCSQGAPHRLPHGSRRDHQRPRPPAPPRCPAQCGVHWTASEG
jgi:hypothetical protein